MTDKPKNPVGRPPLATPKVRPKPVSIRIKTQAARDFYIALGGAKWFNALLTGLMKKAGKK